MKIKILATLVAFLAFMALQPQNMEIMTSSTPNWPKKSKKYFLKHVAPSGLWNVLGDLCSPFIFFAESLMLNKDNGMKEWNFSLVSHKKNKKNKKIDEIWDFSSMRGMNAWKASHGPQDNPKFHGLVYRVTNKKWTP